MFMFFLDKLSQDPKTPHPKAMLKREPPSQESFGMARVELGAEDQGSQKLIQYLGPITKDQGSVEPQSTEAI